MKKNKFSILYVDDEDINLRVFQSTFEDEFEVFTANSGDEGIKIFENENIDLIITDQRMPEMTGVEFLKRVIDLNPEPNRILLTGFSDIDALSSAINEGKIYQYINKPWDESDLKPVIYQALESYYIKKENQRLNLEIRNKNEQLHEEIIAKEKVVEQLKASESALRIAKDKAEESDRLKTSFLNNMSHEIRTPLNGIVGFAELICREELSRQEKEEFYSFISQNTRDLLNIVSNVVLLSQLETGIIEQKIEAVHCLDILDELVSSFKEYVKNKPVRLTYLCQLNEEDAHFMSDAVKLSEILRQLIDNALKFTSEGEVLIRLEKIDNKLLISVKDSGIGIDNKYHSIIYDRFRKIEHNQQKLYRGNGLGLSIAKAYAEIMNGSIQLISSEGKGAEFILQVPFIPLNPTDSSDKMDTIIEQSASYILIVEDEHDNIELIKAILRKEAKQYLIATNGLEAVEMVRNHPEIDLVLMDLRIPELNGFEATRKIKELRPELSVVAQSAYAFEAEILKAHEVGCSAFIVKPITFDKIARFING